MIFTDDKRTISDGPRFWVDRESERDWHYCKYCYRDVPTFVLSEGEYGSQTPVQRLRCCYECGSGLALLPIEGAGA